MSNPFIERKPWAAAVIAFFLGSDIGCYYLNKGWRGLLYFILTNFLPIAVFAIYRNSFFSLYLLIGCLRIVGAVDCYLIAKRRAYPLPMKWYSRWYVLTCIFVIPLFLGIIFRTFCYEPFHMPSSSMTPNLNVDDYFFLEKFAYNQHAPERGDIIIFKFRPENDYKTVNYNKRVIGIPGDKVQLKHSILYINDVAVPTRRIEDYYFHGIKDSRSVPQFIETLPGGKEIRVLDEYQDGPSDNTPVYIVPSGKYFVLGDNRDHSQDSRHANVGFIALEDIRGKAVNVLRYDSAHELGFKPIDHTP